MLIVFYMHLLFYFFFEEFFFIYLKGHRFNRKGSEIAVLCYWNGLKSRFFRVMIDPEESRREKHINTVNSVKVLW